MHRRKLLTLLDAYEARYGHSDEERLACGRMRAFAMAHEDCFERSCVPGHITGSAWVVNPSRDRVLLTHHRKLDIWVQLGGHSDGESDPAQVALTEATEESGLEVAFAADAVFDIDIHEIPARGEEAAHLHYDVRFAFVATHEDYVVSSESKALAWVPVATLEAYTTERSMLRMRDKWSDFLQMECCS